MPTRNRLAPMLAAMLALTGCASARMGQHAAVSPVVEDLHRLFVVNRLDDQFQESMPADFAAAIVPALARCGVAAMVYRPDPMELDGEARFRAAIAQARPDAVLNINQTRRFRMDGEVRSGSYLLQLLHVGSRRLLWHANIGVGASTRFLADRRVVGPNFADEVVRTLAADQVLKTCPPFPPKP